MSTEQQDNHWSPQKEHAVNIGNAEHDLLVAAHNWADATGAMTMETSLTSTSFTVKVTRAGDPPPVDFATEFERSMATGAVIAEDAAPRVIEGVLQHITAADVDAQYKAEAEALTAESRTACAAQGCEDCKLWLYRKERLAEVRAVLRYAGPWTIDVGVPPGVLRVDRDPTAVDLDAVAEAARAAGVRVVGDCVYCQRPETEHAHAALGHPFYRPRSPIPQHQYNPVPQIGQDECSVCGLGARAHRPGQPAGVRTERGPVVY